MQALHSSCLTPSGFLLRRQPVLLQAMFHLPIAQLDFPRFWYSSINPLAGKRSGSVSEVSTCRSLPFRPGQQPGFELLRQLAPLLLGLRTGTEAYQHILPPQLADDPY